MASSSIKRYNFDANVAMVLFAFPVAILVATAVILSRFARLIHKWETARRTAPLPVEEQGVRPLFRNCAIPPSFPAPHSWQYRDRQQEPVKLPPQVEPTFPLAIPVPVAVPAESLVLSFGTSGDLLSQEIAANAPASETEEVAPVQIQTEEETSESIPASVKVKTPRTRTKVAVAALAPSVDAPTAPLAPVSGEEEASESIPPAAPEGSNSPQEPVAVDDLDAMSREDLRALRARLDIKVKGASKLGSGALRTLIREHRAGRASAATS